MAFGHRLKNLRENKDMSREELAKHLNLSYWAVSKYELGERMPDANVLQRIADFFEVTVDYLIGRTDVQNEVDQNINKEAQLLFGRINRLDKAGKEQVLKALDWIEEIEAREKKIRENQSRRNKKS